VQSIAHFLAPRDAHDVGPLPVLVTTYQAFHAALVEAGFPQDLSRVCVVSDEAHRVPVSDGDGWRATRRAALEGGAFWVTVTATGWREDTTEPVHADDATTIRIPVSRVVEAGMCPRVLDVHVHGLSTSLRWGDGEELNADQLEMADYREIVEQWLEDARPKTVIRTQSRAIADLLEKTFRRLAPDARVLNATGPARRPVDEMIATEAAARTDGSLDVELSQFDVVICCVRFTEGTDWPFASHIYVVGVPGCLRFTIQLIGRGRRAKIRILGYGDTYPDYVDRCVVRLFVPHASDSDEDPDSKRAYLRDLCVLYSVLTEDYDVARDLVDIYGLVRDRIGSEGVSFRTEVHRVIAEIFDPPAHVAVEIRQTITALKATLERKRGGPVSVMEMIDELSRQLDAPALEKARSIVLYVRDQDVARTIPENLRVGIRSLVERLIAMVVAEVRAAREPLDPERPAVSPGERPGLPAAEIIDAFRALAGEFDGIVCAFGERELAFRSELEAATSIEIADRAREMVFKSPHFWVGTGAYERWCREPRKQRESEGDLSPYLGLPPGTYTVRRFRRDVERGVLEGQPEDVRDLGTIRERYIG
jgi:hypothetical protein